LRALFRLLTLTGLGKRSTTDPTDEVGQGEWIG